MCTSTAQNSSKKNRKTVLFFGTHVADIALVVGLVAAAVLADVVGAAATLTAPVEDEPKHLETPNAALAVETDLL